MAPVEIFVSLMPRPKRTEMLKQQTVPLKIWDQSWVCTDLNQNALSIQVYHSTWPIVSELLQMSFCCNQNTPNQNILISKAPLPSAIFSILTYWATLCVCICMYAHAQVCLWKSEDHFWVLSVSLVETGSLFSAPALHAMAKLAYRLLDGSPVSAPILL